MYRHVSLVLLTSFVMLPGFAFAGPREGVAAEFRAVEEGIRKKKHDPEVLRKTLESNLVRAMRAAIQRRFYEDQEKHLEGLSPENLSWEKTFSDNVYFVKFRYFIVRFDFARDPRLFIQAPVYEKFLIMDEFEEDDSHKAEPTQ